MDRVLAIAGLRFKLLARRVQGTGGAVNVVGAALLGLFGVLFALGAAAGSGIVLYVLAREGDTSKIRVGFLVVFYACLFLGVVLPLLRSTLDQGFDASPFVLFPVSRRRLYGITLAASATATDHLLYYPALIAVGVGGVLLPGVNVLAGAGVIGLLVLFFVIWSNLIALLLVSVMRARRVREIAAVCGLFLVIGASFLPMLFGDRDGSLREQLPQLTAALEAVVRAAGVLPPSIAAGALAGLHDGRTPLPGLAWMLLWDAVGLILGYRVFDRYHLAERGVHVQESRRTSMLAGPVFRALNFDGRLASTLPTEVRAVAAKDLHYLLRSVVGRFVLFVTPLFASFLLLLLGRSLDEPILGVRPERLLLFGMLLYAVLLSNNFLYNAFAWEGDGFKSYFLSPVSLQRVLLGKNLAVWIYNSILLLLMLGTWTVIRGVPDPLTLISGLFMYAAALLIFAGFGNILSVRFPVPRDMSTTRNQPAQVAILLSLVILGGTGLLLGPFVVLPVLLGLPVLQPFLLAALALATAAVYRITLGHAARLLGERREHMIGALKNVR